ncbi:MAG: AIM24 family protein [Gammaproteobacteria bacterium]|nr:AIM24 family protein [Gammaproteobacteria bacterium]
MSGLSYTIHGSDLQYVEVVLPPNAAFIGEQGAMMYMDDRITVTTVLGDGSQSAFGALGRFYKAVKRKFTGEALFSSRYSNESNTPQRVAFATSSISKIVAIDLDSLGGELICQKGAYLAGEEGIEVNLAWQKRLRVGFFGGEGFIMQRITGHGVTFISSNGALTEMTLAPGQSLKVDSGCLVALSPTVSYEINYAGKLKTAFFGGEGLFYASLNGPGKVWLQSLPERRLGAALMRAATLGQTKGIGGKIYLLLIIIVVIASIAGGLEK